VDANTTWIAEERYDEQPEHKQQHRKGDEQPRQVVSLEHIEYQKPNCQKHNSRYGDNFESLFANLHFI
jgi:hypothetical protein